MKEATRKNKKAISSRGLLIRHPWILSHPQLCGYSICSSCSAPSVVTQWPILWEMETIPLTTAFSDAADMILLIKDFNLKTKRSGKSADRCAQQWDLPIRQKDEAPQRPSEGNTGHLPGERTDFREHAGCAADNP